MPESCDPRTRAYRNGKTFDECRQEARKNADLLAQEIKAVGSILWTRVLEAAGYDEVVYKLTLKYLRQAGYDIGNYGSPRVLKK